MSLIRRLNPGEGKGRKENSAIQETRRKECLNDSVLSLCDFQPLILQAPYSVFEGDELVLRCQKRGREKLAVVKYTWNRNYLVLMKALIF